MNTSLSPDERAELLLAQMTLEEKVGMVHGESNDVSVTLDPNSASHPLSYWNVNTNAWEIASGDYQVLVGASSQDIRLTGILHVHDVEKKVSVDYLH